MKTNNIAEGTLKITFANVFQYVMVALFYIIVIKTNVLTQADIGSLSLLSVLASTFSLLTLLALPTALTKFTSEKLGKNKKEEATAIQKTITISVIVIQKTCRACRKQ